MFNTASFNNVVLGSAKNLFILQFFNGINDSNGHTDRQTGRNCDSDQLKDFEDHLLDGNDFGENKSQYSIGDNCKEEDKNKEFG
jgi:hypothetical protein